MADEDQNFQIIGQTSVIDAELTGLFAENLAAKLQGNPSSTVMGLVKRLQKKKTKKPDDKDKQGKDFFQRAKEILFDSDNPDYVIRQIWDDNLTLGVCAKPLKAGDVAWKCEDCEKDPTCIICLDCFNNSDHEGHRTWLKTNVGGCCDCGDPEGWDMKGACSKHRGIDSSKDEALNALPDDMRERAPTVMESLTKNLKSCLLGLIENQNDLAKKVAYEAMVAHFIEETDMLLA